MYRDSVSGPSRLTSSFQLSTNERVHLKRQGQPDHEKMSDIFLLWTLKEAYSKALGLGLGFDFSRIEYDFPSQNLRVDGTTPHGWDLRIFDVNLPPLLNNRDHIDAKTYRCSLAKKLRDSESFSLSNEAPPIRYLELSALVNELMS
jgi:4'-phosphopantetheinyl transferase